ncbi:MAG: outer membrane lipoprotein carrier protein LolA [Thermodesulfobacteriota bacterium]
MGCAITTTPPVAMRLFKVTLLFLLTLSGCATLTTRQELLQTGALPETVDTLKASAIIRVEQPGRRAIRGRAHIVVERPGRFRIEVLGPFNQTALILTSDGRELSLFDIREGTLFRWSDSKGPYPLKGSEIADLLLGALPGVAGEWRREEAGGAEEGPEGGESSFLRDDYDLGTVRIAMGDYHTLTGVRLPYLISMNSHLGRISVQYRKVALNIETAGVAFTIPTPSEAGIKEIINR